MNNEYVTSVKKHVKEMLAGNKKRYWHTIGVANTCACLAMRYGVDIERTYIAGLLHDCAKCLPDETLISECRKYSIEITDSELAAPYLLHGKVGALYARLKFNIADEELLSAIECHTTGKPAMTLLEEILFIADYIEPYRDNAPNLEDIRRVSFVDITEAVYRVCNDTLEYLKSNGSRIDATTVETYEYYKDEYIKTKQINT